MEDETGRTLGIEEVREADNEDNEVSKKPKAESK